MALFEIENFRQQLAWWQKHRVEDPEPTADATFPPLNPLGYALDRDQLELACFGCWQPALHYGVTNAHELRRAQKLLAAGDSRNGELDAAMAEASLAVDAIERLVAIRGPAPRGSSVGDPPAGFVPSSSLVDDVHTNPTAVKRFAIKHGVPVWETPNGRVRCWIHRERYLATVKELEAFARKKERAAAEEIARRASAVRARKDRR